MLKKGLKARPHDLTEVVKLGPKMIEFHTDIKDLDKELDGKYDIQMALHAPEYDGSVLLDLASPDEKTRLQSVKVLEKALDTARRWAPHFRGTPKLVFHPGGWSDEPCKTLDRPALYDNFFKAIADLNTEGVDFLVENMPPHPWFYGGQWHCNIFMDPKECRDLCAGHGLGFCLDICHAFLWCQHTGFDFNRFLQIVKPVMAHVHFSDARGTDGEGLQIGEGELPLKLAIETIGQVQVGWIPEVWQMHRDGMREMKRVWELMDPLIRDCGL